jgi:hypothetical protein
MRCQTCGEELREGARFCPTCGTPTQPGGATTPPTVQIRRSSAESAESPPASDPESPAMQQTVAAAPQDISGAADETIVAPPPEPAPRAERDPGAGYDPVGPPRRAPGPGAGAASAAQSSRRSEASMPKMSASSADFNTLVQRLLRLLRLDTSVFAELYADTAATIPVAIYAAAVLILSGLGGMFYISSQFGFDTYEFIGGSSSGEFFIRSIILGTVFGLVMLAAWSGVTMLILRQVAGVDANVYGIARVLGVAVTPLVLSLLLFINDLFAGLSWIAFGGIASLALIGVLEAIDVKPGHAWLATLLGFAAFVIVLTFLGYDLRDYAPGFFVGS